MAFSFYYSFRDESGVRRFLPYRLARAARHARTASPCGCAVAWRRAQTQDSHAVVVTRFVHENNHDAVGWFEHKPPERTAPQSVQIGHAATGGSLRRTRAAGPALVRGSLLRRTRNRRAGGDEPTMAGRGGGDDGVIEPVRRRARWRAPLWVRKRRTRHRRQ